MLIPSVLGHIEEQCHHVFRESDNSGSVCSFCWIVKLKQFRIFCHWHLMNLLFSLKLYDSVTLPVTPLPLFIIITIWFIYQFHVIDGHPFPTFLLFEYPTLLLFEYPLPTELAHNNENFAFSRKCYQYEIQLL